MEESDQAFHESQKPSWGPDGTLIYAMASGGGPLKRGTSGRMSGSLLERKDVLVSEGKDICFVKFATTTDVCFPYLHPTRRYAMLIVSF